MKRKITKIAASILGGILLVSIVFGAYAEMPDEDILTDNSVSAGEETAVTAEVPGDTADAAPAGSEGSTEEDAGAPAAGNAEETETTEVPAPAGEIAVPETTEEHIDPVPESEDDGKAEPVSDPDAEPKETGEPEAEAADTTVPANDPDAVLNENDEPETDAADAAEPANDPEAAPTETSESETDVINTAESVNDTEADPGKSDMPEPEENGTDVTNDGANDSEDVTDGDLVELDDDDFGYVDPAIIPETLASVSPEMRFEGITELHIGSEVNGIANEGRKAYHYIHSGHAQTIVLTLYASQNVQVQINDTSARFMPAVSEDGSACLVCETTVRAGDTYISLSAQSVSYRLKADKLTAAEETRKETTEEITETEESAETVEEVKDETADESAAVDIPAETAEEVKDETADESAAADIPAETAEEVKDETADESAAADIPAETTEEVKDETADIPAAEDIPAETAEEVKDETADESAAADIPAETTEEVKDETADIPAAEDIPAETAEETEDETAAEPATDETPAETAEEDENVTVDEPEAAVASAEAAKEPEAAAATQPVKPEKEIPVTVHSSIEGQKRIYRNSYVKLTAELPDDAGGDYTVQWYYSPDQGATRIPVPGANRLTYIYQINDENFHYVWSVKVTAADD